LKNRLKEHSSRNDSPRSGPAIASMIAGHTPIGFTSAATAAPQVKDDKLRALAVMSKTRLPVLPQVPTMAEAGHGEIECDDWLALLVPAAVLLETTFSGPDTKRRLAFEGSGLTYELDIPLAMLTDSSANT
jgi:hypothetical protein